MRLNMIGGVIAVLLAAAVLVAYSALFTVYQTQQALVLRLGKPQAVITEPGLHVKAPFIDTVVYIDKRILDLEAPSQEVIASDQKRLVVDAFARYRIHDPLRFYQTLGSKAAANSQLNILLNSTLRRVLGEATFIQVVRDQRAELMARIRSLIDKEAANYGIEVVDARIRRADLPEQNSQAVYQRMQTARQREAAEYRAQGQQQAQEIRAKADREVTVLVADATSKSEQIRGEGDATRNKIFAEAFEQDPDFFAFYRSMQAYEDSMHKDRYAHAAQAGFGILPLFRRPVRQAAGRPEALQSPCATIAPPNAAEQPRSLRSSGATNGSRAGQQSRSGSGRRNNCGVRCGAATRAGHDRLSRRPRSCLRDRGADLCGAAGRGQAGHDERAGDAGAGPADGRPGVGRSRCAADLAGRGVDLRARRSHNCEISQARRSGSRFSARIHTLIAAMTRRSACVTVPAGAMSPAAYGAPTPMACPFRVPICSADLPFRPDRHRRRDRPASPVPPHRSQRCAGRTRSPMSPSR